jgi:spore coat protein U-like protein
MSCIGLAARDCFAGRAGSFRIALRGVGQVQSSSEKPNRIALALIAMLAFAPLHAAAASTVSRSFSVSVMVVLPECVVSATAMRLSRGNGTGNGTMFAARPVVTVHCNTPVPYSIGLGEGMAAEISAANLSGPAQRGPALLSYSLKSSSGEEAQWGRRIGVALAEPAMHTFTVVGALPAKEDVADGPGPDTITVTITY